MQYLVGKDNFTKINETKGTIQNASKITTIEVSNAPVPGSGILLSPTSKFTFEIDGVYVRCVDGAGAEVRVVPFEVAGEGGGGGGLTRPDFALNQIGSNVVSDFAFSALEYPNTTNPNLDGKTVLVLTSKDVNGESDAVKYVFVDLAKVIDVYSAGDSSILVTDGDISVQISKAQDNILSLADDGLFANLAVSGAVSGNFAIFDESGRVVNGGLSFADLRYELPTASSSTKGGVKVGSGLSISDDTLSAPVMTAASSTAGGASGLVPAPSAGDNEKFLRGDGSWVVPTDTNTTYSAATTTTSGLMSASDKSKLNGIESGAEVNAIEEIWVDGVAQTITNKKATLDLDDYAKKSDVASVWKRKGSVNSFSNLPTNAEEGDVYNIKTAGGTDGEGIAVKAGDNVVRTSDGKWDVLAGTVDLSGYVEKVTGKQLSTNDFTDAQKNKLNNLASITTAGNNITISGGTIKSANTTYSDASTTASGLMSASDKIKLNGIAASANNYTLPTASSSTKGGVKIGTGLSMSSDTLNATVMTAATSSASGKAGLVPAPAAGKQTSFLRGDGTWVIPTDTNTTYSAATTTTSGLMSAADKKKLNNLASITTAGDNITITNGTISGTANTTYSAATTVSSGLMSAADKKKLNSLASITTAGSNITISGGTISAAVVLNTVSSTVDGAMWIEV